MYLCCGGWAGVFLYLNVIVLCAYMRVQDDYHMCVQCAYTYTRSSSVSSFSVLGSRINIPLSVVVVVSMYTEKYTKQATSNTSKRKYTIKLCCAFLRWLFITVVSAVPTINTKLLFFSTGCVCSKSSS